MHKRIESRFWFGAFSEYLWFVALDKRERFRTSSNDHSGMNTLILFGRTEPESNAGASTELIFSHLVLSSFFNSNGDGVFEQGRYFGLQRDARTTLTMVFVSNRAF